MREIVFEDFKKRNKGKLIMNKIYPEGEKRAKRRPRDPDEERALIELTQKKIKKYLKSKRIEKISPRVYKINIKP